MVEVSNLYDLDIYTIRGEYVGKVNDVVLNIRLGTISKIQVRALEPEKKEVGIRDIFKRGFQFVPEEDEVRSFQEGVLNIPFEQVIAVADIILIKTPQVPRGMPKVPQAPQTPPVAQVEPEEETKEE